MHWKRKNYFRMMWNDILYVGWQWNHGLMLWWRFHCTGKYSLGLNNPWPSNPSAVLKHQPTDSLWMGSSEVSSLVRISSADYSRLASCGGVNIAWKRSNFPPDGVSGNRSSGGVKCHWPSLGDFTKRGGYVLCGEATPHDLLPWVLAIAHMVCWESIKSQAAVG